MSTALNRLGALEAARKLQRRELTAEQLVRACFARIEQRESTIHAWTALQKQAALERAQELDRGALRGVLHGLPMGVKDLFDTVDLPTRYGSPIYERHLPGLDAASVALCRGAGAIVVGKTVTTEFATYLAGPTRNPRNEAYSPGGSSSGSAAAVADDMVPFALGTQTAASIIRPASYCGIVGFKPTFGSISRAGVKSLAESLDTIGGFARSVPDVALFASVLMRDPRMLDLAYDGKPRIGMYRSLQWRHALPETKEAYAQAAAILSRAGAVVEELPLPPEHCVLVQLHSDIMAFEASQALAYERLEHAAQLSPKIQAILEAGSRITAEEHQKNLMRVAESRARVDTWFDKYDVLLAPSASGEAPFADLGTGDPQFSRAWTVFGHPTLSLPFATGPQGLPVGLQLVGARYSDHRTLAMAQWVHQRLLAATAPDIGAADIWPRG
ncbi:MULTISPECIES: amidase [Achromobacter]|jgi:Asp-tRNA(Asn)/Glu-tRNA(Gln) amidotransferase A subunit family amidase|uniref:Amidase n=1 Tax=Alcaligenes xylosoxydans xylosoxydans TaxID=85698 RepID=A0A424W4K3_ALCXX|nr:MULTISPECIES: amidase [Achromobacter]MBC9907625.1 amidase [Achromobacter xylosoxidans]MBD0871403.1 amidase [Achromobacter xylosoxidans]MDH1298883.1 amidase [Achromobacter sp. GD03932]QNP86056.1 amidase [Achromobacter xylosoxidans]RPJ88134.1 amidase [Achromobacter xylosoxidans]